MMVLRSPQSGIGLRATCCSASRRPDQEWRYSCNSCIDIRVTSRFVLVAAFEIASNVEQVPRDSTWLSKSQPVAFMNTPDATRVSMYELDSTRGLSVYYDASLEKTERVHMGAGI